jgi:hypothetical protein
MVKAKGFIAALAAAAVLGGSMVTMPATAQAGASTGTWKYYGGRGPYAYRHRGSNWGPAVAAGAVGGLALGALAARPAYGYGYYDGGYYGGDCYWTRQRVIDAWGYPHWRRVQVCN